MSALFPEVFHIGLQAGERRRIEAYGWIYEDALGNFVYTVPRTANANAGVVPIGDPPKLSGRSWRPVAVYHTHPYDPSGQPDQRDYNGTHFSSNDIVYAREMKLRMIVAVYAAASNELPETAALRKFAYDPQYGRESQMSTVVGAGGC